MKKEEMRRCVVSLLEHGMLCAEWPDDAGEPQARVFPLDDAGPRLDLIFKTHRIDAFRFDKMPDKVFDYIYKDLCACKNKAGKKNG